MKKIFIPRNFLIALLLLLLNGAAWLNAGQAALPEVEARLDPQIAEIREKIWGRQHGGEAFSIAFTEQMAAEAVAWYLERHPSVPFSHPQVSIDPEGLTGGGLAHVLGLRTPVHGRVRLWLDDQGVLQLSILELGVAGARAPGFVLNVMEEELKRQVDLGRALPVELKRLEMREGEIWVEGVYSEE